MEVYAFSAAEFGNRIITILVDPLIALMAFLALLLFIFAAIRFIHNADSASERGEMFKRMAIIIFGIFIIFSIYTIFSFISRLANSDIDLKPKDVEFGEYELVRRTPGEVERPSPTSPGGVR